MKKITITLGNNESKFIATIDEATAKKIFQDTVTSIINSNNSSNNSNTEQVKKNNPFNAEGIAKIIREKKGDTDINPVKRTSVWEKPSPERKIFKLEEKPFSEPSVHYSIDGDECLKTSEKSDQSVLSRGLEVMAANNQIARVYNNNKQHLCYYKCVECGHEFFKMAKEGDTAKCQCGKDVVFDSFTQAIYQCSNCSFTGYFKVAGTSAEPKEINCKGCESPIDMKYRDDKHSFQSLNMFK